MVRDKRVAHNSLLPMVPDKHEGETLVCVCESFVCLNLKWGLYTRDSSGSFRHFRLYEIWSSRILFNFLCFYLVDIYCYACPTSISLSPCGLQLVSSLSSFFLGGGAWSPLSSLSGPPPPPQLFFWRILSRIELQIVSKTLWVSRASGCVSAKLLSHVRPFATPWTVVCQAPLSIGFPRQEYWDGLPCPPPGDLPDSGIEPASLTSSASAGGFFTSSATPPSSVMNHLLVQAREVFSFCEMSAAGQL